MRDLAYKTLQIKEKLIKETQKEPTIEQIAKELGVDKEDIVVSLDAIQDPVSLQEPIYNEGSESIYIMDQIKDQKNTDELWAENITIEEAMKKYEQGILSEYEIKGVKKDISKENEGIRAKLTYTLYGEIGEQVDIYLNK